ncbi:YybH family protein [Bauldia sp.]|uniref:YybH family protein n=1 Tax=Bauldia sp. TaxID=2575872 RepID=UPI003BAA3D87
MTARDDIIAFCDRLGAAYQAKDADAIAAGYAPDAVIYDLAPPLARRGLDRDETAAWLATWDGPVTFDGDDVDLVVAGDLAWMTMLSNMRGTKTDGTDVDLWFRTTTCFRNTDDGWRIVHDHASVPFLMDGSERAALALKP